MNRAAVSRAASNAVVVSLASLCSPRCTLAYAPRMAPAIASITAIGFCALAVTAFDAVVYHYVRPLIDGVESPIPRLFTAVLLLDLALYGVVATIAETLDYARRTRDLLSIIALGAAGVVILLFRMI